MDDRFDDQRNKRTCTQTYGRRVHRCRNGIGWSSICVRLLQFEVVCFFETGDILDTNGYEAKGLNNANHSLNKLYIALETATYI